MTRTDRPAANGWGLLLGAAALAGGLAAAARVSRPGEQALDAAAAQGDRLDRLNRAATARLAGKTRAVVALLEGRLALAEAAARFAAINRARTEPCWACLPLPDPGGSEEERLCREVITWAEGYLGMRDPCLGALARARLEDELEAMLRQAPLRLPDVPPWRAPGDD
jgi:hypothetical protein